MDTDSANKLACRHFYEVLLNEILTVKGILHFHFTHLYKAAKTFYKAVDIWKNVFDKWNQGMPQSGNKQWGIHFAFKDGQSRPATITDACPDVYLH